MGDEVINIGINHPAYKVSKREILDWMNTSLNSSLANCDKDVGDGAAYAQVFHSINTKCVPIKQIKWNAKSEYEFTINYSLVQKAMKKLKIDKVIPAEALMKGKPLDNIEFCQWLKHYHSNVGIEEDYDGFAEREAVDPGCAKKMKKYAAHDGSTAPAPAKKAASKVGAKKPMASNQARPASRPAGGGAASAETTAALKAAQEEAAQYKEEISELNLNVDALTKERDFYFGKLRDVEIMIQEREGDDQDPAAVAVHEAVKAILYATDDAEAEEEVDY